MTSRQISLTLRHRLLNCYIYSIFLYGAEAWTIGKDLENKINAFEMWCLRRMGKISWKEKKTNEEVCQTLKTSPGLLNKVKTRKLQYFGHIKRHNTIQKDLLEGKLEGTRAVGRQRLLWIDNIKAWTEKSMRQCTRAADNRREWQIIARQPQRPHRQR